LRPGYKVHDDDAASPAIKDATALSGASGLLSIMLILTTVARCRLYAELFRDHYDGVGSIGPFGELPTNPAGETDCAITC
jgi:hypothetical protein